MGNDDAKRTRSSFLVGAAASALLLPASAGALPKEGDDGPSATVEDADGFKFDPKAQKGYRPVLILYEDKDSAKQNQKLKDDLAKLAKGDKYKAKVALAAIADVSSFDFWPARGFVQDAIRGESKKAGTTIYCDWKGTFRQAFGLAKNTSNVVLIGKNGKVLFAKSGTLDDAARKRVLALLESQV